MRITLYLIASMAGLSLAAPADIKRRADLDPLGLGPAVEDVVNQATGLVGSIIKRELPLDGLPLIANPLSGTEKGDEQS
jgi:hypothetical protein